jgi:hypothetical protein
MSVKQTYILTRPNTGIAWPEMTAKFKAKCKTYDITGKRKLLSKVVSNDGLKLTAIGLFDSDESRFNFNEEADVQEYFNARDIYCINNGITAEAANEEVDD